LNSAVVTNSVVTPWRLSASPKPPSESTASRGMIAIRAPLSSAPQISNVAASNAGFDRWATVSAAESRT
jgi:hypothetical protein